jgi:hypothetical protein
VVPLFGDRREPLEQLSDVLEHYMLQSEQLDTTLVLAADEQVAAGLLIQRLPVQGANNLGGRATAAGSDATQAAQGPGSDASSPVADTRANEDEIGLNEHYNRIAILAKSLKREELLTLDVDTILRRLFWEEPVLRFEPLAGETGPRFACSCSRERVGRMIRSLGVEEAEGILAERGHIEGGLRFLRPAVPFRPGRCGADLHCARSPAAGWAGRSLILIERRVSRVLAHQSCEQPMFTGRIATGGAKTAPKRRFMIFLAVSSVSWSVFAIEVIAFIAFSSRRSCRP